MRAGATRGLIQRDEVTVRGGDGDSVIRRAFGVLDAFADGVPELSLDELAERSGLPRSTAHRLAGQLADRGALERSRRGWRLGTRMFELGQLVAREQRLRERAIAYMQDLYAVTGETVQLAVKDGESVLYVEIISGHRKVASPSRRGGRMPLHCTALGKALLAFSSDGGRGYLAAGPTLSPLTPHTIVDRDQLRAELHAVRADQVAYDREEAALGLRCIAAPIIPPGSDRAIAALSVSMPADGRLAPAEVTPAIRAVARAFARTGLPR